MTTKRTTTDKRYDAARKRRDARNTGKPAGDKWPEICSVDLDNGCKLQILTSPGSDKFDPAVQLKLSKARGAVCVRLSAGSILDLVEMINEYTDEVFDLAESFERPPVAERIPNGVQVSDIPAPPSNDDGIPAPPTEPAAPMPPLDRRSEESMRNWLIEAAPKYAALNNNFQGKSKAWLKGYVDLIVDTGRFNQKGARLS